MLSSTTIFSLFAIRKYKINLFSSFRNSSSGSCKYKNLKTRYQTKLKGLSLLVFIFNLCCFTLPNLLRFLIFSRCFYSFIFFSFLPFFLWCFLSLFFILLFSFCIPFLRIFFSFLFFVFFLRHFPDHPFYLSS